MQTIKGTALEGKIPVTGFDRYFDGECFSPTMTTIERPRDQVAYEAVRLLHELHEKADGKLVHRELSYRFLSGIPVAAQSMSHLIRNRSVTGFSGKICRNMTQNPNSIPCRNG